MPSAFDGFYEWTLFTVGLIPAECRYPFKAIHVYILKRGASVHILPREALAFVNDIGL